MTNVCIVCVVCLVHLACLVGPVCLLRVVGCVTPFPKAIYRIVLHLTPSKYISGRSFNILRAVTTPEVERGLLRPRPERSYATWRETSGSLSVLYTNFSRIVPFRQSIGIRRRIVELRLPNAWCQQKFWRLEI